MAAILPSAGRGANALVHALVLAGVRRVFTLSGNHIMPVFDAAFDAGLELVHVRHEAAAVHMADAWARLTGEVGIAMVTGGPGHANALGALYTAAMAESPVLLLSGHAPLGQLGRGAFQEMRQADVASPLVKTSSTLERGEDIGLALARAWATARSGRAGPVHLSLPQDLLDDPAEIGDEGVSQALASAGDSPTLAERDADALVEWLAQAKRPLMLVGPWCAMRGAGDALRALEEASGIPVVGMESPRGVADPALGAFAEVLAQADRVLLIGKRVDFTLRFGGAFAASCEFHQLDPEASEVERTRKALGARLKGHALASAADACEALTGAFTERVKSAWREEVRSAIAFRPSSWDGARGSEPGRLHPVEALRPLQALLDVHPDAVFVSDGGEFGQWAQACLRAPHRVINGVAGSIGASLPFAVAASLAFPDAPVVATLGDGTFGFHCAEIDTAIRCGARFVALVGNDARWNAEYQIQLRDYGADRLTGCELLPTRYEQVAQAFGGHGEYVTESQALAGAVRRARESGRPAVINAMIDGLAAPSLRR